MDFVPINPLMTVFHDDHLMDPMVHLIVLTADLHMESTSYISSKSNYWWKKTINEVRTEKSNCGI
jgi:hypothetical protein